MWMILWVACGVQPTASVRTAPGLTAPLVESTATNGGHDTADGAAGPGVLGLSALRPPVEPAGGDEPLPEGCGFTYEEDFAVRAARSWTGQTYQGVAGRTVDGVDIIAHPEPPPAMVTESDGLTMPDYSDDMPVFERGLPWLEERCYELPSGAYMLDEAEAYAMYVGIAELTTGVPVDSTEGVRSVVGVRGAYPGTFAYNGNMPDRFNDTIVLLWVEDGQPRVREFPVTTETGAVFFGYHSSSQLRPNRRYGYVNGWHRGYNALQMDEWGYGVRDDSNGNGFWDSDRNGWYDGGSADHDREGFAHNIHMGSVGWPLGGAEVQVWSAGCQVLPGMANWDAFIHDAWTGDGDQVEYFLVDVRDIAERAWGPCTADGSHACPYVVDAVPHVDVHDTRTSVSDSFDEYNCSSADESGPELVYVVMVDDEGWLTAEVTDDAATDVDVHILDGNDPDACIERGDTVAEAYITPGRHLVVVDSYVDGGTVLAGEFELRIDFQP